MRLLNFVLRQLALNTTLLPSDVAARLLKGNAPPLSEILGHLLTVSTDCDGVTRKNSGADWIQKRLSRQALANTFLLTLMFCVNPSGDNMAVWDSAGFHQPSDPAIDKDQSSGTTSIVGKPQSHGQEYRESLIQRVLEEVQRRVDDELATSSILADDVRREIREEITSHTRHIANTLTVQELEDQNAFCRHIENAVRNTRHRVHLHVAQQPRSQ